jgi:uncharacterized MAPEG superfamily protein
MRHPQDAPARISVDASSRIRRLAAMSASLTLAHWCLLVAAILPIATVGFAKITGGVFDNNDPRGLALRYEGRAKRAHAAHLNGFEAFPLFAMCVLVAEKAGGPQGFIDAAAVVFVVARLGYVGAYIADTAGLRSILWFVGFAACIAIFLSPLWR